eukprot:GFUD01023162.1.p1 GENE.GFUD01023162.1~~GFUD01023162.1.p1  ORF type:complete len:117 (-),score=7.84 GFUD01023162.1:98-448(-)
MDLSVRTGVVADNETDYKVEVEDLWLIPTGTFSDVHLGLLPKECELPLQVARLPGVAGSNYIVPHCCAGIASTSSPIKQGCATTRSHPGAWLSRAQPRPALGARQHSRPSSSVQLR